MNPEEKRNKVIEIARGLLGVPYQYGAYAKEDTTSGKPTGFDCSSFIQYTYRQVEITLPRSSILQATQGSEVTDHAGLLAGDLLFFEGNKGHYDHSLFGGKKVYIGHVGIYSGEGKMIHAVAGTHSQVVEQNLSDLPLPLYEIAMIKRVIG